jgi:hypothetical protein
LVKNVKTGRYEIVSGKIVGDEPEEESASVVIYRKMQADTIEFDKEGKKVDPKNASAESDSGDSGLLK